MQTAPTTTTQNTVTLRPVDRLKNALNHPAVQDQFRQALEGQSGVFISSLIELFSSDKYLQECNPKDVIMEALKAATLRLPINKSLGFAYIIAYKEKGVPKPQFQLGYKGILQLAMRSGQYRHINADTILEGELQSTDKLTGEVTFGPATGPGVVGYFAHLETLNGFKKTVWASKDQIAGHAKRFSKSFNSQNTPWKSDFDAMAIKTVIKRLFSRYGIMSIEMQAALASDQDAPSAQDTVDDLANQGDFIDITPEPTQAIAPATEPGNDQTEPAKAPF